jgi:hypothetical protein
MNHLQERWTAMWALSIFIFFECKFFTWMASNTPLNLRSLAYCFAWPGLNAQAFLTSSKSKESTFDELCFAIFKWIIGLILFFRITRLVSDPYISGWVGMIGIVMILHFGFFHALSCFWRNLGINAEPLMNWPICSSSLSDFWGKRWNTAFRDLTHRFLFRPLLKKTTPAKALMLCFAFSGVIHAVVISLPAKGYSYNTLFKVFQMTGPYFYFIIQGLGILLENNLKRYLSGWRNRVYAGLFLIFPLPLLFHRPFVLSIIIPFMRTMGALS